MTTLEQIRAEYDRLDRLLGIDTSGVRLAFSKRMSKQYGVCTFRGLWPEEIRIADFLRRDETQLLVTARHEYAHAAAALLTGRPHGHDETWKAVCRQIGCPPSRLSPPCQAMAEKQRERAAARGPRKFYVVECLGCHKKSRYQRRGRVVQTLERQQAGRRGAGRCTCRSCGGTSFRLTTETEGPER